MRNTHPQSSARQRGAALVVGLILLLVLTLLAVTGMNTATTELIMAGNEQFRQNAFQAAETGIEQALATLSNVPTNGLPVTANNVPVPNSTTDAYSTSSRYLESRSDLLMSSNGKFVSHYFDITSTGTSSRNASVRHVQGAYLKQFEPNSPPAPLPP
jgi:type IV pilus assembly protein PilX